VARGAVWLYLDRAVALAEIRLEQSQQELRLEIARRTDMTYQLANLILGQKDDPIASFVDAEDAPVDALFPENVEDL
jgi:hypothetical protein